MQSRHIEITAERGRRTATREALREAGCARWSTDSPVTPASEAGQQAVVALARQGYVRIDPIRHQAQQPARITLSPAAFAATRSAEYLERAVRGVGAHCGHYHTTREQAVAEILRRVGPAGEQALADEERYFRTFDEIQYDSSRHSGRDWRAPSLAVVAPDGASAIICYVEAGSYLHKGVTWSDCYDGERPGGLHHLRFRVYLVVRDATTGERHVLRIPPRFGRYASATYRRYMDSGDRAGLIRAAIAWTFGLRPADYHPEVEA